MNEVAGTPHLTRTASQKSRTATHGLLRGWRYEFGTGMLHPADEMRSFPQALRIRAAELAAHAPEELAHALIAEYRPRTEWEHGIPPVESLRHSITFRSWRRKGQSEA